jgi:hypothetical protein
MLGIIAGAAIVGAALWGPIVSNVEQAKYTVSEKEGSIEIRNYAPMIVAEVEVSGERDKAINQGFRMIAKSSDDGSCYTAAKRKDTHDCASNSARQR